MHMPVDLRKLRYLINVLGLTLEEALHIDVALASECGLMPQPVVARPVALNGRRAELQRLGPQGGAA